ncbi:hypothetical protein [Streptococcus pneumoniae]|uniref:hypothetical protein n=1 Tax=Streptococcus pneumoniae TaxID=1313 RepID=UPI0015D752E4|nr:hypothetical protein [Streptococcus pneumoniae]
MELNEVSSKHCFEVVDETKSVTSIRQGKADVEVSNHTHGKAALTWFEEIF